MTRCEFHAGVDVRNDSKLENGPAVKFYNYC